MPKKTRKAEKVALAKDVRAVAKASFEIPGGRVELAQEIATPSEIIDFETEVRWLQDALPAERERYAEAMAGAEDGE